MGVTFGALGDAPHSVCVDARALNITAIRHVFIAIADLLAATSLVGLAVILFTLFQSARAGAAAETERRLR